MLQLSKSQLVSGQEDGAAYEPPPTAESSLADQLSAIIGFIRRHFLVLLSVVPLTLGLAVAYLYITPPLYSAEARIMIEAEKLQLFKQSILGDEPVSASMIDSQLEILRSDNFGYSVINKLNLTQDPEFLGSKGTPMGSALNLVLNPLSAFYSLKDFLSNKEKPEKSEAKVAARTLEAFEKRLTVSRVGLSYAIAIDYQSSNPDRAAYIANAVADAFIVDQLETKYQTIGRATAWLQDRLSELRVQASAAERAVVEYKSKNNIVDTGGRSINEQQLSELNTSLLKARADTIEAKARLDRVSPILTSNLDPATNEIAAVAESLHNEIVLKFRQQYLELRQREALLSARLGQDHIAVVNIRNQIREIRNSIFDELKRIAEASKSDYEIAKTREGSLQASLTAAVAGSQTTNKAQIELRQLESAAQNYRALYDNFQQHYMDSVQQQSFPVSDARIITRALAPSQKSSPKSLRILAIGVISGLGVGFGLAMLREMADRVFRTSRQVEAKLKVECLTMLPMIKLNAKIDNNEGDAESNVRRTIAQNATLRSVVESPLSRFAESLRAVKLSLDLGHVGKSNKIVGVTSSLPNEGKSTVSACLAQLCAHAGARVILIDGDLRKPSLSKELARHAAVGLIDVVLGTAKLDEVIWIDPSTQMNFLPVGAMSRLTHTNEVLASGAMERLVGRLRESYDYVIIDLSPLAPVIDVRSTTHLLDCYLFVVEWGKTKIDIAEHALNSARGVYDNLLGVILNKVDFKRLTLYDQKRSQYYYNSYYASYGYTD